MRQVQGEPYMLAAKQGGDVEPSGQQEYLPICILLKKI
jgi:hypothetical protein